jgi:hypothetical protein
MRGDRKGFSSPMKGMAKRAFNIHPSKTMNLPSRIKGLMNNRNNKRMYKWLWKWQINNVIK